MFNLELADSMVAPPSGEAVDRFRDHGDGDLRAICLPSLQMLATPMPLRHFSSTGPIHSSSGYIWLASMWNQPWTEELVCKVSVLVLGSPEPMNCCGSFLLSKMRSKFK